MGLAQPMGAEVVPFGRTGAGREGRNASTSVPYGTVAGIEPLGGRGAWREPAERLAERVRGGRERIEAEFDPYGAGTGWSPG